MHNLIFLGIARLRQNYWYWPRTMTLLAVLLGVVSAERAGSSRIGRA